ncbi:MAG: CBS domain-containing protein [Candidatus Izemoplasmatales bacterium]
MTNAEKYIEAFRKIESALRKEYGGGEYKEFMGMIRELREKNSIVRNFYDYLRDYAELRNAIVHKSSAGERPIAEPYPETVAEIEKLYGILVKPQTAFDLAVKPVHNCETSTRIIDVVKIMKEKIYTQIPILDGNGNFAGIFSESTLVKWLADSVVSGGFILEAAKVADIQKYLDQGDDKFNTYKFAPREMNIFDVKDMFLDSINKKERLGAIFVTQNGSKTERILGIITAWDLSAA